MWVSKLKITAAAVVVLAGLGFLAHSAPVNAADNASAALGIAPRKDYTVKPGETIKDKIRIQNIDNTSDLELNLRVIDFTSTDETGTPKLLLDKNAEGTTWSLKSYLKVPEHVVVPANSSKSIDIELSIPENRGGGSLYSAIMYQTGKPGDLIGLNASGVTLVFANIPGPVDEKLTLEKLGLYREATPNNKAGYDYITTKQPSMLGYTLKNEGNVVEAPAGSMTIKGLFGREHIIDELNPNKLLALIDQTRTFTTCVQPKAEKVEFDGANTETIKCGSAHLWPGYYKVSLEAYYGQNGNTTQEIIGSSAFWYLPIWFLAVLLVVLILLAFMIFKVRQRFSPSSSRRRRRN